MIPSKTLNPEMSPFRGDVGRATWQASVLGHYKYNEKKLYPIVTLYVIGGIIADVFTKSGLLKHQERCGR